MTVTTGACGRPMALLDYDEAIETLRPGARPRGPRRARHRDEDVLRLPDRVRRRAEHPGVPGLPRPARLAAGDQPDGGRVGDPDRSGAELLDRAVVPVRAEELLLPRHAEELPDLAVRRADRLRRLSRRRVSTTATTLSGSRSSARTWRRTPASPCTSAVRPAGSTAPSTRCSTTTGPACRWSRSSPRRSTGTKASAPAVARAYVTALRDLLRSLGRVRRPDGPGLAALRREPVADARPGSPVFGTRTETKNVNSLRSVERAVRYEITRQAAVLDGGRPDRCRRPGTSTSRPGTTAPGRSKETAEDYRYFPEPDLVPLAPDAGLGRGDPGGAARAARGSAGRGCRPEWGLTDLEMRDLVAAGAVDLVAATVAAGAPPAEARSWWVVVPRPAGQRARRRARRAADHPAQLAAVIGKVADGSADHQAGPAGGRRRARRRGRTRRGHRGPRTCRGVRRLGAAVGASTRRWRPTGRRRQDPRRARSRRSGAIVGAVMKATRGQADAARVRELVLRTLGASG